MGIQDLLRDHPAVGGLVGGATIGAGTTGIVNFIVGRASKTKKKSTTKTSKKRTSKTAKKRTSRTRKTRNKSPSKKIYTTKNGQPYIKLANGKARFISKKSAKTRRKRKGGYY